MPDAVVELERGACRGCSSSGASETAFTPYPKALNRYLSSCSLHHTKGISHGHDDRSKLHYSNQPCSFRDVPQNLQ
jgi:hypothetical protein